MTVLQLVTRLVVGTFLMLGATVMLWMALRVLLGGSP